MFASKIMEVAFYDELEKCGAYRAFGALTGLAKRMGGGAAQGAKKKMTGLGRTTYSSLAPKKAVSGFSRL